MRNLHLLKQFRSEIRYTEENRRKPAELLVGGHG
ncbi:hypothetical protein X965_05950 [Morganella sp. EGD-HP17]|nr:hypothetical protein X965_05950 [Morganella sp. EGD-HP17]